MTDTISLEMSAIPENTLAVRLLAAGLANLLHFDSEEIEDIKLSVSEACAATPMGDHKLQLRFLLEDAKMTAEIQASGHPKKKMLDLGDATEEGIGMLLMRNLMDAMEFRSTEDGTFVRLEKYQRKK